YLALFVKQCKVATPCAHILSSLEDHRLYASLQQFQCSEETAWSCTNYYYLLSCLVHILEYEPQARTFLERFINECLNIENDKRLFRPRIDGSFENVIARHALLSHSCHCSDLLPHD